MSLVQLVKYEEIKDWDLTNSKVLVRGDIKELRNNLEIKILDIHDCPNLKLPKGLKVETLDISYSGIEYLPEDLEAQEIYIDQCKNLKRIPKLKVEILELKACGNVEISEIEAHHLEVESCNIKQLPKSNTLSIFGGNVNLDNIQVEILSLQCCDIKRFPKNVKIAKLNLRNCPRLKEVPEGLEKLWVNYCPRLKITTPIKKLVVTDREDLGWIQAEVEQLTLHSNLEEFDLDTLRVPVEVFHYVRHIYKNNGKIKIGGLAPYNEDEWEHHFKDRDKKVLDNMKKIINYLKSQTATHRMAG